MRSNSPSRILPSFIRAGIYLQHCSKFPFILLLTFLLKFLMTMEKKSETNFWLTLLLMAIKMIVALQHMDPYISL